MDVPSVLRPRRKAEPLPPVSFLLEVAFFSAVTQGQEITHVTALNAGSHWLLCSGRELSMRLAAGPDQRSARQFATVNDAYRHARSLAPKPLKFDIR